MTIVTINTANITTSSPATTNDNQNYNTADNSNNENNTVAHMAFLESPFCMTLDCGIRVRGRYSSSTYRGHIEKYFWA